MPIRNKALCGASVLMLVALAGPSVAQTAAAPAAGPGATTLGEVIVTAQKRQENIQNIGMSIQAASGDKLTKLGVTDVAGLQKVVPGLMYNPTLYGNDIYTIRGVGFQDISLGGNPTVTVYQDQFPLPYSALTKGSNLDLERVEVLKGPQGTLFGENATGGAVNYIARKPTDHFEAGGDLSYARFSDTKINAYVSGPLTDTLDARLAVQTHTSSAWQKGYGPQAGQSMGGADFLNGRLSLQWKPISDFTALMTVNAWKDKSYNQFGQLYGTGSTAGALPSGITDYPLAPHDDRAAGFNSCVNTSPFNPIAGQELGAVLPIGGGRFESVGPGSVAQAGGQPTSCVPPRNNNSYYSAQLRMDYNLPGDMTLTSLSSFQQFDRSAAYDGAGLPFQLYQTFQTGRIASAYQELRLSGKFARRGDWIVGANYEHDNTWDRLFQSFAASPNASFGTLPLGPSQALNRQDTDTFAVYANGEYPILDNLNFHAGIRFTQSNKEGGVCGADGGDGTFSTLGVVLQQVFFGSTHPVLSPPGTCTSTGPASANFNSPPGGGLFEAALHENNVSWRTGLDWQVDRDVLLYANVSKGWKAGSFPTLPLTSFDQTKPVTQEGLLAYEVGFKSTLLDHQMTLNGAAFYYDYTNKQLLGGFSDPLFGSLAALVNVPKSHVIGFELSGAYAPQWLEGLTLTPAVSYQYSAVDKSSKNTCAPPPAQSIPGAPGFVQCVPGQYYGFDGFGQYADFTHEHFAATPVWQASFDAEYRWRLRNDMTAYVGGNLSYTSDSNGNFHNRTPIPGEANDPLSIPAHTLVDLRAGVDTGAWQFQVWGHNVGNTYYWTEAVPENGAFVHYTGMPVTYGITISHQYR